MQRLSESVQRKFIDVIALDDWEIETPSGWQPVSKIMKTVKYRRWRLVLENGYILDGADQHIVITQDGERFLEDIVPGEYVCTNAGLSRVVMCVNTGIDENMYDVEVDDKDHVFYSNGIVSHNTTVAAGYLLHQLVFNKQFTVALLANKGEQSIEVLTRIKGMYEELPLWMQPGVRKWNEKSIFLGHKSRAFCASTSPSSIRGKSINILYIDEFAHIENDVEFYQSTYPVIMAGKTTKVIITSTPNGLNLFYKIWTEAEQNRNDYKALRIYWHEHPDRDPSWLVTQERNMPPKQIAQEVNCVTGDSVVQVRCVISGQTFGCSMSELHSKQYERTGFVYKLTRADGLCYIGVTLDYDKRVRSHSKSKRFSTGISDTEILFEGPYSECCRLEEFFIGLHDTWANGLNVTRDGKGLSETSKFNTLGVKMSAETKRKISEKAIGRGLGKPGPVHTDAQKAKWSRGRRGKPRHPSKIDDVLKTEILKDYQNFHPSADEIADGLAKKYVSPFLNGGVEISDCRLKSGAPYSKVRHFLKLHSGKYGVSMNGIVRANFLN